MIHFSIRRCPKCNMPFEFTLLGINSRLGPSLIECRRCKLPIQTDRYEWTEFNTRGRFWFVIKSLIYMFVFGVVFSDWTTKILDQRDGLKPKLLDVGDPRFLKYFAMGAFIMFLIQGGRVLKSIERTSAPDYAHNRKPSTLGLLSPSFTFGGHVKFIILILICYFVCSALVQKT